MLFSRVVLGVPKYRTPKPRLMKRKFGPTRLFTAEENLITCNACGFPHHITTICGVCYEKVRASTNAIKKEMMKYNPYLGERQIDRKQAVADREMEKVVFDLLHDVAFNGSSLSRTILGPNSTDRTITQTDLKQCISKNYKTPRMDLTATVDVNQNKIVNFAEKYFGTVEHGSDDVLHHEPGKFSEAYQVVPTKNMELVYGALAVEGPSWTDPNNMAMQVINTMLGQFDRTQGTGLLTPSRLAQQITHNAGVQSYLNFTTNYKDTGLTGIYFVAEPSGLQTIAEAVCGEWRTMCDTVNVTELERAKRSLFTNISLVVDGSTNISKEISRQLLCYGRRYTIQEIEDMINSIDAETIKKVCRQYFVNKPFACTVIGQIDSWPTQKRLKQLLNY